jgi:electron transfer flavoprotein alpha subunit
MRVLIVAEHDNKQLKPSTLNCVSAGLGIQKECDLIVIGYKATSVVEQAAKVEGVRQVWHVDAAEFEHPIAEAFAKVIVKVASDFSHILAPASTFGKDLMPQVAAILDVAQISDIILVKDADTFVRPIYAGNVLQTVKSSDACKIITVRTTAYPAAKYSAAKAPIESLSLSQKSVNVSFVSRELSKTERPELTSARVVVSGGRALQSSDNFKLLETLADTMHAAIGASRAAVDAGYVPNDYQVGQTGKVVAPELYIAIGISGAVQHIAGMKDSKCIVAINKDADAPIFEIATYGLVGDLFDIVPELTAELQNLLSK